MERVVLNFKDHDGAKIARLRARWSEVTDRELCTILFPPDSELDHAALAVVCEEFVRRGLAVPVDQREQPRRPSWRRRSWSAVLWGLVVYALASGVWWIVLFPMFAEPSVIDVLSVKGILTFLLLVAPPGIVTVLYLKGQLRRFLGDPEGLTRCGACAYVLNGLKQLRCPRCGESI